MNLDLRSVEHISTVEIPQALGVLAKLQATLLARLFTESGPQIRKQPEAASHECLLTAAELAERLGTSTRWVYRHAKKLGVIRLSEHKVRFSEAGLRRFLKRQAE